MLNPAFAITTRAAPTLGAQSPAVIPRVITIRAVHILGAQLGVVAPRDIIIAAARMWDVARADLGC